jgi:hypothetical protein
MINSTTPMNVTGSTMGDIRLGVPNRYFVPQTLVYENGGIIRFQNDGQAMVAEPRFSVANNSGASTYSYTVSLTHVWLFGTGSASGTGFEGINSRLIGMDAQSYDNINTSIYLNLSTEYGRAWFNFYNNTLLDSYDPGNVDFSSGGGVTTAETSFYLITLTEAAGSDSTVEVELKNTDDSSKTLNYNIAYIDITIGKGGTEF